MKFYSSTLSLLKKVTVVLKDLPSFRDFNWVFSYQLTEMQLCYFFSCLLRPLRAKIRVVFKWNEISVRTDYNERVTFFSIMWSPLSQLSNKYCDCELQFRIFFWFGNWIPTKTVISKLSLSSEVTHKVTNKGCFLILA